MWLGREFTIFLHHGASCIYIFRYFARDRSSTPRRSTSEEEGETLETRESSNSAKVRFDVETLYEEEEERRGASEKAMIVLRCDYSVGRRRRQQRALFLSPVRVFSPN